jgi:hypothetical protein
MSSDTLRARVPATGVSRSMGGSTGRGRWWRSRARSLRRQPATAVEASYAR